MSNNYLKDWGEFQKLVSATAVQLIVVYLITGIYFSISVL